MIWMTIFRFEGCKTRSENCALSIVYLTPTPPTQPQALGQAPLQLTFSSSVQSGHVDSAFWPGLWFGRVKFDFHHLNAIK